MAAYKIILWFSKHKTINGLCPVISQIWGDFFLNPKKGQESTNDSVRTERTTRQYYHMPHLTRMLENVKTKKSLIELRKVLRLIIIWPCNGLLMILCFQPKPKLSFEIRKSCAVLRGSMQFWQRYCYIWIWMKQRGPKWENSRRQPWLKLSQKMDYWFILNMMMRNNIFRITTIGGNAYSCDENVHQRIKVGHKPFSSGVLIRTWVNVICCPSGFVL